MTEPDFVVETKSEQELLEIAVNGYQNSTSSMIDKLLKKYGGELTEREVATMMLRMSNLTGPKTVEGRIKSLMNLKNGNKKREIKKKFDPKNPHKYFLEDEEEIALYEYKRETYIKDYELNDSADSTLLEQILMIEVEIFRLTKLQQLYHRDKLAGKSTNVVNPTKELSEKRDDLKKLIQALGADRRLRKGGKEDRGQDIATMATRFEIERDRELRARQTEMQEEEENMTAFEEKRQQELAELGLLGKGFKAEDHTSKAPK